MGIPIPEKIVFILNQGPVVRQAHWPAEYLLFSGSICHFCDEYQQNVLKKQGSFFIKWDDTVSSCLARGRTIFLQESCADILGTNSRSSFQV